jgi:hypothetical protein
MIQKVTTIGNTTIVATNWDETYTSGLLVKFEIPSFKSPNNYLIITPTLDQAFEIWEAYTKLPRPVCNDGIWQMPEAFANDEKYKNTEISIYCGGEAGNMAYTMAVTMMLVGPEAVAKIVETMDEGWS